MSKLKKNCNYNNIKTLYFVGDQLLGDFLFMTPMLREIKKINPLVKVIFAMPTQSYTRQLVSMIEDVDDIYTVEQASAMFNPSKDMWFHPYTEFYSDKVGGQQADSHAWAAHLMATKNDTDYVTGHCMLHNVECTDKTYTKLKFRPTEITGLTKDLSKLVVCARHSHSCTYTISEGKSAPNKTFDNSHWLEFANYLISKGYVPIAVGSKVEAKDERYREWPGEKLYGADFDIVATVLQNARAVVSIDTGIRHIAASLGKDLLAVCCSKTLNWVRCYSNTKDQQIIEIDPAVDEVTGNMLIENFNKLISEKN